MITEILDTDSKIILDTRVNPESDFQEVFKSIEERTVKSLKMNFKEGCSLEDINDFFNDTTYPERTIVSQIIELQPKEDGKHTE